MTLGRREDVPRHWAEGRMLPGTGQEQESSWVLGRKEDAAKHWAGGRMHLGTGKEGSCS